MLTSSVSLWLRSRGDVAALLYVVHKKVMVIRKDFSLAIVGGKHRYRPNGLGRVGRVLMLYIYVHIFDYII